MINTGYKSYDIDLYSTESLNVQSFVKRHGHMRNAFAVET